MSNLGLDWGGMSHNLVETVMVEDGDVGGEYGETPTGEQLVLLREGVCKARTDAGERVEPGRPELLAGG